MFSLRIFSWKLKRIQSPGASTRFSFVIRLNILTDLPIKTALSLRHEHLQRSAGLFHLRPSPTNNEQQKVQEYKPVIHRLPPLITGLALGPTNPKLISIASETLGIRRCGFSPQFRYSCQHSHFPALHPASRRSFTALGTLPYHSVRNTRNSNDSSILCYARNLCLRYLSLASGIFGARFLVQ